MAPSLPAQAGPAREQAILDLIAQGHAQITWAEITSTYKNRTAVFRVFADALRIDGLRVNLSAASEQRAADLLDCSLLTAKLADMIWLQRQVTLPPLPRINTTDTAKMIAHSASIDAELEKRGNPRGLICTVGKHWIVDNEIKPGMAMNYGWHCDSSTYSGPKEYVASLFKEKDGQYGRLVQGRGSKHDPSHVDYSQTVVLVSHHCTLDGQDAHLADILTNPDLAPLASHQGVLHILRQPGVVDLGVRAPYFEV